MKVLFIIDSLEGYGAEKSLVQIALHFKTVTPVFIHLYSGEALKSLLEKNKIKVYSLNLPSNFGTKKACKVIYPIIDKENPHILHSTLYRSNIVSRRLKFTYPNIILIGSFVSNSYGKNRYSHLSFLSRLKLFRIQLFDRWTSDNVDFFISNSLAVKKTNSDALGIPLKKIRVIYRGRDFSDFQDPLESKFEIKKELGLKDGNKIFLNVSRLVKSKGQEDLLESFQRLIQVYPEIILLIVGEGNFREQLATKINNFGLEKKVFLLGYRQDIPQILASSDFFVFPSYYEGLSGALIEAIIAQKPSVVSDIPENRECFSPKGALFYPPGDLEELTKKMEEVLTSDDMEEKVKTSFAHAEQNFKIESVSSRYEKFYYQVLDGSIVSVCTSN